MASTYDIGDVVQIASSFTADSVPIDPSTVQLKVRMPDGTKTTYTYGVDNALVRDSTGVYHLDMSITLAGLYQYRWTSTGVGQASEENWFQVRARKVI